MKKKHIGETPIVKWNSLTPISTFFMAKIIINYHFLSLLNFKNHLSLLEQKVTKNEENGF
jgi:hypothetical protein